MSQNSFTWHVCCVTFDQQWALYCLFSSCIMVSLLQINNLETCTILSSSYMYTCNMIVKNDSECHTSKQEFKISWIVRSTRARFLKAQFWTVKIWPVGNLTCKLGMVPTWYCAHDLPITQCMVYTSCVLGLTLTKSTTCMLLSTQLKWKQTFPAVPNQVSSFSLVHQLLPSTTSHQ